MITLGIILLIVGLLFGAPLIWELGLVIAAIGALLAAFGAVAGRPIAGRRFWY